MNEFSAFISFLEELGYKNTLTFNQSVDLFVAVKGTIRNKIGFPVIKEPVKYHPTGVGVSSGMDGECLRSCDLPVNNLSEDLDSLIIETPIHLV